jgi:hypothetical protein
MSHTLWWKDERPYPEFNQVNCPDGEKVYIHHNGDYSGDALINVPEEMWEQILASVRMFDRVTDLKTRVEFALPAKLLAKFSRVATLTEAVDALEDML